jgi:hypothetical protein
VSYSRGRLGQSYGPWCRAPNNAILLRRASAKLLVCSADTETVTAQRPLHKGYRARSMDSSRPSFLAPSCSASVPLHSHDKNPGIQTHQWCHLSSSIYRLERSLEPLKIYLSIYLLYIKSVLQANQKLEN